MSVLSVLPDGDPVSPVEAMRRGIVESLARPAESVTGDSVAGALRDAFVTLGAKDVPSAAELIAAHGRLPGVETMRLLAARHGLVLKIQDRYAEPEVFPQVVLLKDGSALAVVGRDARQRLLCRSAKGSVAVTARTLSQLAAGPRIEVARPMPAADDETQHAAIPNLLRVLRLVGEAPKARLAQLLAAALLSNLLLVVLPLFTTTVYDRVVPYGAFDTLTALCIGVVIVFAIDIGLRMARVNLLEAVGVAISYDLQAAFYRKLVRAPLAASPNGSSGVTSMLYDIDSAALTAPSLIVSLLADLPFVLVMLLLVGYIGGAVVVVPIAGVIIVGLITGFGAAKARRATAVSHKLRTRVQDQAIESAAMLPMVKAMGAEAQLIDRWAGATDAAAFAAHRARQTSSWSSQISLVSTQIVIAFTVVVGAVEINAGIMTIGNLAACVMLVGRIIAPANMVVAGLGQLANMRQSIGGFFAVIDRAEEHGGDASGQAAQRIKGRFDLRDVNFSYPSAAGRSLESVTLTVREGERVGIIGRNGCGKSTLLKLLVRLHEPQSGTLQIDGTDSRQFDPAHLRQAVGLMAQESVLINDTLRANVCLGLGAVDPEAFERAVQLSGVADFARRHAKGYSMLVGSRGDALSGGERQAVALARLILGNPRVVLLDEPTSAMDSTLESRLIRDLPQFLGGRTVVLATHRMQLLNLVDRIIWMDQGKIVADGPKAEILSSFPRAA